MFKICWGLAPHRKRPKVRVWACYYEKILKFHQQICDFLCFELHICCEEHVSVPCPLSSTNISGDRAVNVGVSAKTWRI